MVTKLKHKTYLSDIRLKCWKFQTVFYRKCYEFVWKCQNENAKRDKYSLIYVLYCKSKISSYFITNHWLKPFTFLLSILVSWKVPFNVSFSFGHNDVNQLQCSVVLI